MVGGMYLLLFSSLTSEETRNHCPETCTASPLLMCWFMSSAVRAQSDPGFIRTFPGSSVRNTSPRGYRFILRTRHQRRKKRAQRLQAYDHVQAHGVTLVRVNGQRSSCRQHLSVRIQDGYPRGVRQISTNREHNSRKKREIHKQRQEQRIHSAVT